jgi:DNA-directed RNA polymerase subunit RPC12/RpoP
MSWMGTHYSEASREALVELDYAHCRRCRYKARLQFDREIFEDHVCSRCGMAFPASQINRRKFFFKLRQA